MKFHTHLPVFDLAATRTFYEGLLGEAPVKAHEDYLKFLPERVALNIAFSKGEPDASFTRTLHLGFELPDQDALDATHRRLEQAGISVTRRETSVCCYANQDKLWVTDPTGYEWELYVLLEDADQMRSAASSCCAPSDDDGQASKAKGSSACAGASGAASNPGCC